MDFVVYDKLDKEIVAIVLNVTQEPQPQFLINQDYVGIYIAHNDYTVKQYIDGRCYFDNLNEKLVYLDDYRGRYSE